MKDYVGKKVKGFKFNDWTNGIAWNEGMEAYIGKVGEVLSQNSNYVIIGFYDDETWTYPISLVGDHLVEEEQLTIDKELKDLMVEFLSWKKEKEEQKERLIEMMRLDEEVKLYNEKLIVMESINYAYTYYDMHEVSYRALQQGFEAGAKWGMAQQNRKT